MAIDRAGVVHIVWPTLVDGPQQGIRLFHASTADGITFTPRQMVQTLGSPKPAHPQMALDRCGDLSLVWDESQDKARRIALRTLTTSHGDSSAAQTMILNHDSSGVYRARRSPSGEVDHWRPERSRRILLWSPRKCHCSAMRADDRSRVEKVAPWVDARIAKHIVIVQSGEHVVDLRWLTQTDLADAP